ncbi:MAG: glycerol-3-phosphate 1-O-acyltransferase PlsY [Candidatus Gastranaerophilales bacterium]|nr:glycerol-3-phosphate 1-O-acyltransferase PlsY [Candidatus Gastranaerophilales bacterium]
MISVIVTKLIFLVIISYIIGSIPTGYIIVKAIKGIDIRTVGSGSTGATNVKRVLGKKWFFIVMFIDALKGALPVMYAHRYLNFVDELNGLSPVLAGLGAIIGHSKSVFLKFTGGKSVATGVGVLIGLCWQAGLSVALIWGIITYISKYVSLGSVIAISLSPIIIYAFNQNLYYVGFAAICAVYVVIMHKPNIIRLLEGKENKVRK